MVDSFKQGDRVEGESLEDYVGSRCDSYCICYHSNDLSIWKGKNGDIEGAKKVLTLMKTNGIKRDLAIYNALIICHSMNITKAEMICMEMKEERIEPNVATYNSMIDAYEKNGDPEGAEKMGSLMKKDGIRPTRIPYSLKIVASAKTDRLVDGPRRQNSSTPPREGNYDERTKMKWKEQDELERRLKQLVKAGEFEVLLKELKDIPFIKAGVFAKLLQPSWGLPLNKEIELKERVLGIMWESDRGVISTAYAITPMISLYRKVQKPDKADSMLKMTKEKGIKRNPTIYNALMKCHSSNITKIELLYTEMQEERNKPNVVTYTSMIDAYKKDGDVAKAIKTFESLIGAKIDTTVFTYTSMINAYAKDGDMYKAKEMLDSMIFAGITPNVVVYNTMIDGYVKNGWLNEAIGTFNLMIHYGITPNFVVFNSMFHVYVKKGWVYEAIGMFESMKWYGITHNSITFRIILDCYAKTGKHIYQMMLVLKEMREASVELDIRSWNILMEGFSRAWGDKDKKKALSIWRYLSGQQAFESMGIDLPVKESSVLPDATTLAIALDVCKFGRFIKEADKVWMYGQKSVLDVLNSNVLTSYVEALASFGKNGADHVIELIMGGLRLFDLPEKTSTVLLDGATLLIAFDVCMFGRFKEEAFAVWMYGQRKRRLVLNANVLTSYVECLSSFGKDEADRVV
jgi:pentatricopeptide repeat protein